MRLVAVMAVLLASGIVVVGGPLVRERWSADGRYRRAERWYQAGDFEKAEIACEKVLRRDPSHAPARALFMEVQFLLGRGKPAAAPSAPVYADRQTLSEIDAAFARADRAFEEGEPLAAKKELRKILEYAKWLPAGVEVVTLEKQARSLLDSSDVRRCDR